MFRRLLVMILLLALSAPALAMSGHCAQLPASPQVHTAGHHTEHHPAPAQPERRDCIGCILPDLGLVMAPGSEPLLSLIGAPTPRTTPPPSRERPEIPPPRA